MAVKAVPHIVWAAIVLLLVTGGYIFLREHDARLRAELKIEQLQRDRDQIQQTTKTNVAAKQDERKQADSPQKQIEYVTQYVHTPTPTIQPAAAGEAPHLVYPDAPSTLQSQADFVSEANITAAKFEGCKQELGKCDEQRKELEKLRNQGFWRRLTNCGIRVGIGSGTGAIFGKVQGAVIGGGIGLGTCWIVK